MKVVIVDDHPMVRQGLKQTIELEPDLELAGSASCVAEGLELIKTAEPDLAVVDLKMPDGSGLDLISRCKKEAPGCSFLILTAYGNPQEVSKALSEHVGGYILKESLPEEIIDAIKRVGNGRRYFDPEVMETALNSKDENPLYRLTPREMEVLHAVSAGMNNTAIAEKLHISDKTVKKHISNLISKLDVQDRIQAALFGFSQGMGRDLEEISS